MNFSFVPNQGLMVDGRYITEFDVKVNRIFYYIEEDESKKMGLFNSGKLVTLIDMSDLKDKHQELSDIYSHYMEEGGERHE